MDAAKDALMRRGLDVVLAKQNGRRLPSDWELGQ
jgi:hypothetical protein